MITTLLTNNYRKMKKILFLFTALLLAAPSAFAYDFSAVAPSGQTLYYLLDCTNLTATVVPENASYPYYTTSPTGDLTIPSSIEYGNNTYTVTTIGENAFRYCNYLTSVTIPNSITSIGDYAFFDCWGIESLSIGNSVETIGFEAFASCNGLSSITVAADNTHFDSRNNCNAIIETSTNTLIAGCQSTVIPNSVTAIGDNAFGNCETLTTIHIPSAVSYIHERAFMNCSGLISMTVDANNTHYDSREDCNAIIETSTNTLIAGCRNTVIPNSVTSIAGEAFRYCRHLTSITIPSKVASIGSESFYGCYDLAEITLLAAIPPSIGNTTFQYVSTDIPVNIPCGTLAAYQAAYEWSNFTNFVEGDIFPYSLSVTSADNNMGSSAITTEPTCTNNAATITAYPICGYRFVRWEDAAGTTVSTDNPYTLAVTQDTALTAVFETTLFAATCPSGQTLFYKIIDPVNNYVAITYPNEGQIDESSLNPWGGSLAHLLWDTIAPSGTLILPDTVTCNGTNYIVRAISAWTFLHCPITSLVMSNTIDSLASNAFLRCTSLTDITYSNTLRYIGENALRGCRLGNVVLPSSVRIIGVAALTNSQISSITLNDSLEVLESWSLSQNPFTSLYIPASVKRCGTPCWYMGSLSTIVVDPDNPYYDSRNNCNAILNTMGEVLQACNATVLPEGTTRLYGDAFRGCRYSTFVVPNTVTDMAFHECHIGRLVLSSPTVKLSTLFLTVDTIQFLTDTPPVSINNYDGNFLSTPILVPCNSLSAYQADPVWGQFTNIQEQAPYTLSVTTADNAMGSAAVTVAPTCTNNNATVTATPNSGYLFDHWSDGNSDNPRTLTITQDTSLTAIFGISATTDTSIHIHMELAGDSLFTQEGQSMVVTHPDSTYIKLRFDVEPTAERVEFLDQGQNVVATFLNATEEHVFRLTTGLYTIRAVFPGGATFEGTIDFVNELQE